MVDIFGEIAYTINRTWFCRILSNHVEMCRKKVHEILSNSSFSIDFSKIIVYTKDRERRFSKNRIRKGFIDMKKKILSKAAAVLAVGAIVTGLSGAMAVPASALTINGLNTKMEYTVYTTRVSDTRIRLTIKITNNPGIANYSIAVKSDPAFKAKQHTQEDPRYSAPEDALISNYYYNEENHQSFLICVMGKTSSGVLVNYIEYDIDKNDKGTHEFKIAFVDYSCPSESSNNYRYEPDEDFSSSDATVKVSQNEYVRLGDINCNNKVDTTDIFYLMQMVAEAKDNKISTVELDAELKNKNSSWYKNYSFLKCAAVADVTQDGWIKEDDKDELMLYVAQKGAGKDITNDKIDTLFPVTYVYNG